MTLAEVTRLLDAKVYGNSDPAYEIGSAYAGDLVGNIMANVEEKSLLITGLLGPQVIHAAEMTGFKAIVFVDGKIPGPELSALAAQREISVLSSAKCMYDCCALLYMNGLRNP